MMDQVTLFCTSFECRTCDRLVMGQNDGGVCQPGWARLEGIDGPNHICPTCIADDEIMELREEFPNVRVGASCSQVPGPVWVNRW